MYLKTSAMSRRKEKRKKGHCLDYLKEGDDVRRGTHVDKSIPNIAFILKK